MIEENTKANGEIIIALFYFILISNKDIKEINSLERVYAKCYEIMKENKKFMHAKIMCEKYFNKKSIQTKSKGEKKIKFCIVCY